MKKRKITALLTAVAMTAGILAGCGNSAKDDAAASVPEAPASQKSAVEEGGGKTVSAGEAQAITIWYYWETEGHQVALDQVIQEYNGSQDKYEVTAKYVPFADFKKQLSIGASADELPDIAILDSPDHASYVAMGIFEDLPG